LNKRRRRY